MNLGMLDTLPMPIICVTTLPQDIASTGPAIAEAIAVANGLGAVEVSVPA